MNEYRAHPCRTSYPVRDFVRPHGYHHLPEAQNLWNSGT
jgi:hypothetical protein